MAWRDRDASASHLRNGIRQISANDRARFGTERYSRIVLRSIGRNRGNATRVQVRYRNPTTNALSRFLVSFNRGERNSGLLEKAWSGWCWLVVNRITGQWILCRERESVGSVAGQPFSSGMPPNRYIIYCLRFAYFRGDHNAFSGCTGNWVKNRLKGKYESEQLSDV